MATLPSSARPFDGHIRLTGVELGLSPSTVRNLPMELQSATAAAAATSLWQKVYIPPTTASILKYQWLMPLSTRRRYFRARHPAALGYSDGAFTNIVNARATTLSEWSPPFQLTNAVGNIEAPNVDILISSGNKPKVGTQNSSGVISKTIRFAANGFKPVKDTYKFTSTSGLFAVGSTNTSGQYDMVLPLPKGATLTKLQYTGSRRSTVAGGSGQISKATIYRSYTIFTTGGPVSGFAPFSTMTMSSGAAATLLTIDSSALAVLVSTQSFIMRLTLKTKSVGALPSAAWIDVTYTMPSYDKAY